MNDTEVRIFRYGTANPGRILLTPPAGDPTHPIDLLAPEFRWFPNSPRRMEEPFQSQPESALYCDATQLLGPGRWQIEVETNSATGSLTVIVAEEGSGYQYQTTRVTAPENRDRAEDFVVPR